LTIGVFKDRDLIWSRPFMRAMLPDRLRGKDGQQTGAKPTGKSGNETISGNRYAGKPERLRNLS
jgi:hypothetical protein